LSLEYRGCMQFLIYKANRKDDPLPLKKKNLVTCKYYHVNSPSVISIKY